MPVRPVLAVVEDVADELEVLEFFVIRVHWGFNRISGTICG